MDIKIDSDLIKSEREKRAWSQEHLANVSGLGVRTIPMVWSYQIVANQKNDIKKFMIDS